jgi:hypothetical protein
MMIRSSEAAEAAENEEVRFVKRIPRQAGSFKGAAFAVGDFVRFGRARGTRLRFAVVHR